MSSSSPSKRKVPPVVRRILNWDETLSEKFCLFMNKFLPFRSLKRHYKVLEITCNGILWLAGWIAFIWITNSSKLYQMQANFFLGLILDIIFVAVTKAFVRRRRPAGNPPHAFGTLGPDVYSFPSGHASRAAYIATFFMFLFPLPFFCYPPLLAWVTSVCVSRVLMKRHHLLDVLAGISLGINECFILWILWLSPETCAEIMSFMSDSQV